MNRIKKRTIGNDVRGTEATMRLPAAVGPPLGILVAFLLVDAVARIDGAPTAFVVPDPDARVTRQAESSSRACPPLSGKHAFTLGQGEIDAPDHLGSTADPNTSSRLPVPVEDATETGNNSTLITDAPGEKEISRRNRLRSSISTLSSALFVPSKPLFLRFPRSADVISKIILDETPAARVERVGEETEESNGSNDTISSSIEIEGHGEVANNTGKQEGQSNGSSDDSTASATDTEVNGASTSSDEHILAPVDDPPSVSVDSDNDSDEDVPSAQGRRRPFGFRSNRRGRMGRKKRDQLAKAELNCPAIATSLHELQSTVLENGVPLKDVGFRFQPKGLGYGRVFGSANCSETVFQRDDPICNSTISSMFTYEGLMEASEDAVERYQNAVELLNLHPVMEVVKRRVESRSKPGNRETDEEGHAAHLALVIEGGGMRGAVSAGMAAALSTLDLLDAFDSIHGSSAGAIVGAYLISRQLCTDVYTDIMPAAGSRFASKRRGMYSFGVDYLSDLIQRRLLSYDDEEQDEDAGDGICASEGDAPEQDNWYCDDEEEMSSVQLAMRSTAQKRRTHARWSDDHYDGVMLESMSYLTTRSFSAVKSALTKPLMYGIGKFGKALKPALNALDMATSMRQYFRGSPGMNITYILDGVMDENHGLRPFDMNAFKANDARQPLYIVSSSVNVGSGKMETLAFNSQDGDFFGTAVDEDIAEEGPIKSKSPRWYQRIWSLFSFVPFSLFKAARNALVSRSKTQTQFDPPPKDEIEALALPPSTQGMYGFARRRNIRSIERPEKARNYEATGRINDDGKKGLFPCLEASMLVPGAAGPPIQLIRSQNRKYVERKSRFPKFRPRQELNRRKEQNSHVCYDAFCYESIPYRSAVEKAKATHVLALRSRPDGSSFESKQHLYERVVAPIYFRKHGLNQVARLFASGGSQYRYLEDVLLLNHGLAEGIASKKEINNQGVKIPPTDIYFGVEDAKDVNIDSWKSAHVMPIMLPFGSPELPTLCQDKEEVLKSVRIGYAAAFDVLAPLAGLPFDSKTISGQRVAEVLFPSTDDAAVLEQSVTVASSYIDFEEASKRRSFASWIMRKRRAKKRDQERRDSDPSGLRSLSFRRRTASFVESDQYVRDEMNTLEYIETEALLAALPGFSGGRLDHIAEKVLLIPEQQT